MEILYLLILIFTVIVLAYKRMPLLLSMAIKMALVLLLGVALGLIANATREAGLDLSRDHFPARAAVPAVSPTTGPSRTCPWRT